jgi:hypothetical protein
MRVKMLIAAAAILITGVLATSAVGASLTPTKVTIQAESGGDFFGYVKSTDKNHCANNRKVILYKLQGDSPNPSADQKIGSDTAQANGDGYMWSTGNTGQRHGKFYARVKKTEFCAADLSPVVKAQP